MGTVLAQERIHPDTGEKYEAVVYYVSKKLKELNYTTQLRRANVRQ